MLTEAELRCHPYAPYLRALPVADLTLLLDAVAKNPALDYLYITLKSVANTGLCLSELKEFTWADVNFEASHFVLRHSKAMYKRVVPFGPNTRQVLLSMRERHPEAKYIAGGSRRVNPFGVVFQLRRICESIGLPFIHPHVLRGVFFHRFVASGASMNSLRYMGGHRIKGTAKHEKILKTTIEDLSRLDEL